MPNAAKSEKPDKTTLVRTIENLIDENRVLTFSDTVFAFAATLLVLKIDLPVIEASTRDIQLPILLHQLWPTYLANIISFIIISYYWLNHHAVFGLLKHISRKLVWINVLFLLCVSFLPFPVELYGDFPNQPIVVMFYSASVAGIGLFLVGMWLYAVQTGLVKESLTTRHIRYFTYRLLVMPVVFLLSIPIVVFDPILSQFSWLFVVFGIALVNKMFHYQRMSEVEKLAV